MGFESPFDTGSKNILIFAFAGFIDGLKGAKAPFSVLAA